MRGEDLIREPPANDELLCPGKRSKPRGHSRRHEDVAQVDDKRSEHDGKDRGPHPPQAHRDKLPRARVYEQRKQNGIHGGYAVLDSEDTVCETEWNVPQKNRETMPHP